MGPQDGLAGTQGAVDPQRHQDPGKEGREAQTKSKEGRGGNPKTFQGLDADNSFKTLKMTFDPA